MSDFDLARFDALAVAAYAADSRAAELQMSVEPVAQADLDAAMLDARAARDAFNRFISSQIEAARVRTGRVPKTS